MREQGISEADVQDDIDALEAEIAWMDLADVPSGEIKPQKQVEP